MSELDREAERLIALEPIATKGSRMRNIIENSASFGLSILPLDLHMEQPFFMDEKSQNEHPTDKDLN